MDLPDRIFYILKKKLPIFFEAASLIGRLATVLFFPKSISHAEQHARIEGSVLGRPGVIRCLSPRDLTQLREMIAEMDSRHLKYFLPHDLDAVSLARVISRRDIMTYGLFVDDRMCAYAILKLFPTKKAYIGRLVSARMTGLGIGKYLSQFLYYQASLLAFQPCSTIHQDNLASWKSHASVRPFTIASELLGGYRLIKFDLLPEDQKPPELRIVE